MLPLSYTCCLYLTYMLPISYTCYLHVTYIIYKHTYMLPMSYTCYLYVTCGIYMLHTSYACCIYVTYIIHMLPTCYLYHTYVTYMLPICYLYHIYVTYMLPISYICYLYVTYIIYMLPISRVTCVSDTVLYPDTAGVQQRGDVIRIIILFLAAQRYPGGGPCSFIQHVPCRGEFHLLPGSVRLWIMSVNCPQLSWQHHTCPLRERYDLSYGMSWTIWPGDNKGYYSGTHVYVYHASATCLCTWIMCCCMHVTQPFCSFTNIILFHMNLFYLLP